MIHSLQSNKALLMSSFSFFILTILYKNGSTALIMASANGKDDIVELLINAKADINLQDKKVSI